MEASEEPTSCGSPSADILVQDDGVCERCAAVPWGKTMPPRPRPGAKEPEYPFSLVIEESITTLDQSMCRVCRLIARLLKIQGQVSHDFCPIELQWNYGKPHETTFGLKEKPEYISCIRSTHCHDEPCLLISRASVEHEPDLRYLFPPKLDIDEMKKSIEVCIKTHYGPCELSSWPDMPHLKVIDCERIVVIAAPERCTYVALSYVWGCPDTSATNESTLSGNLPATIADSIALTLKLGYKYLWVDRYCIDQANYQEKHAQIMSMADIYNAAHLTIIAAAGNDPTYGLPGVSSGPRTTLSHTKLGNIVLSVVPSTCGLCAIGQSSWAQRAWTFQECLFSRRRLFITDRRAVLVCNTDICYESCDNRPSEQIETYCSLGWMSLPQRQRVFKERHGLINREGPIALSFVYIGTYNHRKLSFEQDALNAIVGALNSLRTEATCHIWGVPLQQAKPNATAEATPGSTSKKGDQALIALLWLSWAPSRRRMQFPSWSPIGWTGHIGHSGAYSLSTLGVLADTHSIQLCTEQGKISLSSFEPSIHDCSPENCRTLSVTAGTAELTDCLTHMDSQSLPLRIYLTTMKVALRFDDTISIIYRPFWDLPDTALRDIVGMKALLIQTVESIRDGKKEMGKDKILLVRPIGDHYERVGLLKLDTNVYRIPGEDHKWMICGESCSHDFQNIIQLQEITRVVSEEDEHEFKHWWRKLFKEETILLA